MPLHRLSPGIALLGLAIAGCAAGGTYPSLQPRAAERALAEGDVQPPLPLVPDDPALPAGISGIVAEARSGQGAFDAALARARPLVARAGAAGSDSWIEAQQGVSRAEAARTPATAALAELDRLAAAASNAPRALSAADALRLREAVAAIEAIAARQQSALEALRAGLRPI
jgi:hypothetical protein